MKILKALLKKDKHLLQELFKSLDEVVHAKGKSTLYIRYARPTKNGWSFLKKKQIPWNLLEDITHQTIRKHPHCHRAVVADTLSRLVNLSEKELLSLRTALL